MILFPRFDTFKLFIAYEVNFCFKFHKIKNLKFNQFLPCSFFPFQFSFFGNDQLFQFRKKWMGLHIRRYLVLYSEISINTFKNLSNDITVNYFKFMADPENEQY